MLAALKSLKSSSAAEPAAKPKPAKPTSEVARLQDQADAFTRKIELERRRGVDLETQIRKTKEKIDEQRRKMGGIDAARRASDGGDTAHLAMATARPPGLHAASAAAAT